MKKLPIPPSGFVDFNGYYDTRDFSVLTLNIKQSFQHGFEYFSLSNITGISASNDLDNLYSEQNIRCRLKESAFDLTGQWVIKSGDANDNLQLGVRYRLHSAKWLSRFFKRQNLKLSVNPFFVRYGYLQVPKYLPQLEYVLFWKPFKAKTKGKLYVAAFCDQHLTHIHPNQEMKWVTEQQVGYMILPNFYLVAEYRINTFVAQIPERRGWGFGLQYKWNSYAKQ